MADVDVLNLQITEGPCNRPGDCRMSLTALQMTTIADRCDNLAPSGADKCGQYAADVAQETLHVR